MRAVVARHCQTDWNAQGKIQGQVDIPLNAVGHQQAQSLAAGVAALGVQYLTCSDLTRARETAYYVAQATGLAVVPDPRWRENAFGTLEGATLVEFGLKYGAKHAFGHNALDADFRPFGGEYGRDVLARQMAALDELKAKFDDQTVMIIGHGRSLRVLLQHLGHDHKFLRNQGSHIVITY